MKDKLNTFLNGLLFMVLVYPIINELLELLVTFGDWVRTKIAILTARELKKAEEEHLNLETEQCCEEERGFQMGFSGGDAVGVEMPSDEEYYDDDEFDDKRRSKRK